jgi:prepilin-type N-terminal cleavage/methylation domain-containing protein
MKRGFTLIELLVVIAIIGLLSTLSVVSFSTAKEKSRISKALGSEGQILRSLGDELVGRWDFDECSGTSPVDSSGNGRNASFSGTPIYSTNTPGNQGCSMTFDGVGAYVYAPVGTLSTVQTRTLWIYAKNEVSANRYFLAYAGDHNYFLRVATSRITNGTTGSSLIDSVTRIVPRKWYFIAAIYDGTKILTYIDGSLDSSIVTGTQQPGSTIYIGSGFEGEIDNVRVYNRALSSREINQMYTKEKGEVLVSRQ